MTTRNRLGRCVSAGMIAAASVAVLAQGTTPAPVSSQQPASGGQGTGPGGPLTFRTEQIASDFGVGYAVLTADINADKRLDVVAISGTELVWFEAPGWQKRVMASKVTERDNVCIAVHDIDRDGKLDVALGASWQPSNTTGGGTLHWVRQPASLDAPWEVYPIGEEPTLHRIRWADVDGDKAQELVVTPLHGRGTKGPEWQGQGARVLIFRPPAKPQREPWPMEVADDTLHILHNLLPVNFDKDPQEEVLLASREGVSLLDRGAGGKWTRTIVGEGSPGEIKIGRVDGRRVLGTIEPWHGASVVVYTEASATWPRTVIESELAGGHALGWGDFDGDGSDELAVGWREGKPGVAVYFVNRDGTLKQKQLIDDGGMATEDLVVADLNGDKRPEIIASGRATRNVRIYWNETR